MANRQQPSRRSGSGTHAPEKNAPSRRNDVIRCENCGEDYSITYKRCPFCDERPGRTGISGRRVDGAYGPVHPIQIIGLVISLVLIIAALFIVFKKVGPLLFGDKDPASSSSISSSQSGSYGTSSSQGDTSDPGASSSGDISQPDGSVVTVDSLVLSKIDFTLKPNEEYPIAAAVSPADAEVTWTSSHPDVITVDADGLVKNINSGTEKIKTTITATAGDKTATCTVYCQPSGTAPSTDPDPNGGGNNEPSGPVAPNSKGVIINAELGLNVRSGPGSSYEKIASASNGAEVTILAEENGWYKVDYGGGKTGYVSKDYVKVK